MKHICVQQIFIHGAFCRRFIYSTLVLCVVLCYLHYNKMLLCWHDLFRCTCVRVRQTRRLRNLLLHFMYLLHEKYYKTTSCDLNFMNEKLRCVVQLFVLLVRECVPTTVCVYVYQHTLIDTHTQSRKSAVSLENIHYYEGFANIY